MPIGALEAGPLVVGLVGGLALFLFGIDHLARALRQAAGPRLREMLSRATSSRLRGAVTGAVATASIQSSSLTMVILVGFVSAGVLRLVQAIPMVMGAEVGTTITAQLIAFPIGRYALVGVAAGFFVTAFAKSGPWKRVGEVVFGASLVFFAMGLMGDAVRPLRAHEPFLAWIASTRSPAVGILLGAAATALLQSSAAMTAIVIALAGQGILGLESAIALVLGANVGTCITGLLAALRSSRDALRLAVVQWVYNLASVAIALPLIPWIADAATALSPSHPELSGPARLAAETPRQIANVHTLVNVACTALFLGAVPLFARVARWIVPPRRGGEQPLSEPMFLDAGLLASPSVALEAVRKEVVRLGRGVRAMLQRAPPIVAHGSAQELTSLAAMDDEIDGLHAAIGAYLGRLSEHRLSTDETAELMTCVTVSNHLESIADMIETNLVARGRERVATDVQISTPTMASIGALFALVLQHLDHALIALELHDPRPAHQVIQAKPEVNAAAEAIERRILQRLAKEGPQHWDAYQIETDLVEHLKRVYYFTKRIAYALVPTKPQDPPEV